MKCLDFRLNYKIVSIIKFMQRTVKEKPAKSRRLTKKNNSVVQGHKNWTNKKGKELKQLFGMAAMPFLYRDLSFLLKLSYHRNVSLTVYL